MAVSYKDYYQILGVPRDADEAAIKRAYRAKARELHPDRNKAAGAEAKFRDVNEAYEVLGDAEKRRRYDALGADWRDGAQFTPPPGFEGFDFREGGLEDLFGGGAGRAGGGASAGGARFSDFFEALFGGLGGLGGFGGGGQTRRGARTREARGGDIEAELELTLADLVSPAPKRIALGVPLSDRSVERRSVAVNIPAGLRAGQRLRLAGQGAPGRGGAPAGDIYLKIRLRAEAGMEADGDDLIVDVDLPA
ncbi:MAG: DnaJ domain-containing protein, partial [Candidatus Polarisedimenticolia bacterium]